MTLNNIDNIFKLNFLGRRRARLAGITESRDSEIPKARNRDSGIP